MSWFCDFFLSSMESTRSKNKVFLLGSSTEILTGAKLPSLRQVLGLFINEHNEKKKTVREASAIAIEKTVEFWQKAKIPTRAVHHCQAKLESEFESWRLLKKNANRTTETQKSKELAFSGKLENLFDIAHAEALQMITISEDRDFLLAQREEGRRGSMGGLDSTMAKKEKKSAEQKMKLETRRLRAETSCKRLTEMAELASTSSETDESMTPEMQATTSEFQTPSRPKRRKLKLKKVVTPKLTAMLDRNKVTDRKAVFVVAETAKSLGHDIQDLALSRSSIRRYRLEHRASISAHLKETFQSFVPLVVHWDGKMLHDLTGKETVDRLPILVSGKGVSQLLIAAKLHSSTGQAQAEAVYNALTDWGIASSVRAMSFDTTSSNTGVHNGACVLLQRMLGVNLLSLACRHHIFELVIGAVFQVCMGSSSAPEVLMFRRFQKRWQSIDLGVYQTGMDDTEVSSKIADIKDDVIEFAKIQLCETQPRDDYKEFLELSVIFLGGVPDRGIHFMAPGAMHHARWMSKVLYSLKVWMFRSQFDLRPKELKGLQDVCIFAVRIYLKMWMTAPLAAAAPQNDIKFLQTLLEYDAIHPAIAKAASAKMANHLWYLSEELVSLALFDDNVPTATKRELLKAMKVI